jgi:hypothetical protein
MAIRPPVQGNDQKESTMTISARRSSCWRFALALGIAATIVAGTAGAAARPPANASETGRPGDLVNRPGCWSEGGIENRYGCEVAGWH